MHRYCIYIYMKHVSKANSNKPFSFLFLSKIIWKGKLHSPPWNIFKLMEMETCLFTSLSKKAMWESDGASHKENGNYQFKIECEKPHKIRTSLMCTFYNFPHRIRLRWCREEKMFFFLMKKDSQKCHRHIYMLRHSTKITHYTRRSESA